MEQQTRRERKKEETRRRILEVAFKLFARQGFNSTTVDQITKEADVGKGTFYNYFPTKEAALFNFMEDLGSQRGEKIWPSVMSLQDTRQRLARVFQNLSSWFEEYPELIKVYLIDRLNSNLNNPGSYQPTHLELYLAEILSKGQEMGDIRDDKEPLELVNYLMGIFLIDLCRWFAGGAGSGYYEMAMPGVDFFLIGALRTEKQ